MPTPARETVLSGASLWGAVAVAAAAAAGFAAATVPELFHLDLALGPGALLGTVAAVLGIVALVRSPRLALAVLLLFVYLNLSEILVRFHGFPSLLQLLILPIAISALLAARIRDLERLALHPLSWILAGYVGLLFLSTAWAWDPGVAWTEAAEAGKSLTLFLLTALLAMSRDRLRLAVISLIAGGVFLASSSLVQVARGDYSETFGGLARVKMAQIYGDVFEPRIAGPLGDPNYYAQILLMVVPLALILVWREPRLPFRAGALGAAAVVVPAILLTYSRGAAVALVVVVGLTILVRGLSRKELLLATGALLVALSLAPAGFRERITTLREMLPGATEVADPDSSFAKRRLVTAAAWRMFLDHPFVGVGAGNYASRFDPYGSRVGSAAPLYDDPGEAQYPHNLYLEVAAETGAVGFLLLGAALLAGFGSLARARARFARRGEILPRDLAAGIAIALAGYLMTSLFLHGHFQRYLWILLALAAAWDVTAAREPARDEPPPLEATGEAE